MQDGQDTGYDLKPCKQYGHFRTLFAILQCDCFIFTYITNATKFMSHISRSRAWGKALSARAMDWQ
jgi:hypothetical protein